MFAYVLDDLGVEEDKESQWNTIRVKEDGSDEKTGRRILGHVVERTSGQEALWII